MTSLRDPSDFQRVISDGERYSGAYVLAFVRDAADSAFLRLGVASSAKAGSKVVRNRLKRLLREAARQEAGRLGPGLDLVLIAKAGATGRSLEEISGDLKGVLEKARTRRAGRSGASGAGG